MPRRNEHRPYPYFAVGPGVLFGLSGGPAYERTRPALTGGVGIEIPATARVGIGLELVGELELPRERDFGRYRALLVRARLGYWLTPSTRLWGAAGIGGAGYERTDFSGALAAGSTFLFTRKLGLDLSANLTLREGSAPGDDEPGPAYPSGSSLLLAARFVFELPR